MTDRSLNEDFETVGEWFLPDAPERKIHGTLTYKNGCTELHLSEPFNRLTGNLSTADEQRYPLIYGYTRDSCAVTVLGGLRMGMSINFGSGGPRQSERILSTVMVIGALVPIDEVYPQVSFRVPGLHIWLSRPSVNHSFESTETEGGIHCFRVQSVPPENVRVDAICAEISWWVGTTSSADPFGTINVSSSGWISIRPDTPQPLDWYFGISSKITTLISFLAGCPMPPDCISASLGAPHLHASVMVGLRERAPCKYRHFHEFFLPLGRMGRTLKDVLVRWFEECPRIWTPAQLAASIFGSKHLWLHVEFLSLMQALEGLHRSASDGTYMNADDYEPVKRAIIDAIPTNVAPDHKASLTARIRYGNQISLAKRLAELARRLPDPLLKLILDENGKVPRIWVDTRNYYTHWDDELRGNILNDKEMFYASVRMRHFLRALYLDLIGIPHQEIFAAMTGTNEDAQFLLQIAERERVERDPNYVPVAYATLSEDNQSPSAEQQPSISGRS